MYGFKLASYNECSYSPFFEVENILEYVHSVIIFRALGEMINKSSFCGI